MEKEQLNENYKLNFSNAEDFRKSLVEQIKKIILDKNITLGVPIESRVKAQDSLAEKLERKEIEFKGVLDIDDFIGIRIILLFKRDLDIVSECIKHTLTIIKEEDKLTNLSDDKFGYQSRHYIVKVPKSWLKIPTFSNFGDLKAEIQVRTISQHIWAAASHKLQYKNENNVPPTLRRALNRASAVLELVDLEFERILLGRDSYIASIDQGNEKSDETLNIENLKLIMKKYLPPKNESSKEDYDYLLSELTENKITTTKSLIEIINSNLENVLKEDREIVSERKEDFSKSGLLIGGATEERLNEGVFFNHTGLIRTMAKNSIGDEKYNHTNKANKEY